MYESAKDRLFALMEQEKAAQELIGHWAPILEQLANLTGQKIPEEIQNRIILLNKVKQASEAPLEDMGLTEAIRWVFRQPHLLPLTPTQVRDQLAEMGYDVNKYAFPMPPIHNTLKRMKEAGEIREVEGVGGMGRAFEAVRRG